VSAEPELQRVDLHTHSHHSDGTLSPTQLVALARQRAVQLLALTDHDTTAGCAEAAAACAAAQIQFVNGIELTCGWRGREIHVVGLRIDPDHALLSAHTDDLRQRRRERIVAIGERLEKRRLNGRELAERALAQCPAPTRMHLARLLVEQGSVKAPQDAFDKFLGRGQPAFVNAAWPDLAGTVQCIAEVGGLAVLAHPNRYRLGNGALRELCAEFKQAGGAGIEVSLAGASPDDAARAASLARRFELAGSIGSDFHEPGLPWRPLGRFAKLPDQVTAITGQLQA
jgi:predicted metal-dependent phosphoesterase TrpH